MPVEEEFPVNHGVKMVTANFFFGTALEEIADPTQLEKWNEIAATPEVRRNTCGVDSLAYLLLSPEQLIHVYKYSLWSLL